MAKPLWRWTCGDCQPQGLDILVESVKRTTACLGVDNWDWAICYNGLNRESLKFIQEAVKDKPIQLISQNWATCPINDNCQTPRRKDGSFEYDGKRCGGTMWKVCPARLRMESHEVVVDNDLVMLKKLPQIEEFLSSKDKVLILEEPIRFYGRYDCLFPSDGNNLNSGLMGFPPKYDFGAKIHESWIKHSTYTNLTQADEQGLLVYTLSQHPNIRVPKDKVVEVLSKDYRTEITGNEYAIHFTQANRISSHYSWNKYQEIMKDKSI